MFRTATKNGGDMELNQLWKKVPPDVLSFLLRKESVRKLILRKAEEKLYSDFVLGNKEERPPRVQEGRYLILKNLLHSIDKAINEERVSPSATRAILSNFVGKVLLGEEDRCAHFREQYGIYPPAFLTISPTKKCNLFCKSCYASGGSSGNSESLSYDVFNKILDEKKRLWGSYFTVISGGEPLLYRDGKKTVFNIFEVHADQYFMMYTNGILVSKETARRMANLGNVTPAVSIEGFEKETDQRRGKGVFKMVLRSMENLRKAGVPFGISVTATRQNADTIMKDKFTDFFFGEMGAVYGCIFQYMPIGRNCAMDLMLTPEQRVALFQREQRTIKESNLFLLDLLNGGPYAAGCMSAGRPGGHFYIDWNGNIAPCIFYPYYVTNIYDVYRNNETLNEVLFSPYFSSIRSWQNEYGYTQPPDKVGNFIVSCIVRDHYNEAFVRVNEFGARPMHENAEHALSNEDYRKRMTEYGQNAKLLTQKHWESDFLGKGTET